MYISHRGATLRALNEYAADGDELEDVNLANFGGEKSVEKYLKDTLHDLSLCK